jgi:hypothetical protein
MYRLLGKVLTVERKGGFNKRGRSVLKCYQFCKRFQFVFEWCSLRIRTVDRIDGTLRQIGNVEKNSIFYNCS